MSRFLFSCRYISRVFEAKMKIFERRWFIWIVVCFFFRRLQVSNQVLSISISKPFFLLRSWADRRHSKHITSHLYQLIFSYGFHSHIFLEPIYSSFKFIIRKLYIFIHGTDRILRIELENIKSKMFQSFEIWYSLWMDWIMFGLRL